MNKDFQKVKPGDKVFYWLPGHNRGFTGVARIRQPRFVIARRLSPQQEVDYITADNFMRSIPRKEICKKNLTPGPAGAISIT
jgi:hypothetical protein